MLRITQMMYCNLSFFVPTGGSIVNYSTSHGFIKGCLSWDLIMVYVLNCDLCVMKI